jgi:ATP-dependent helicase HrpA
MNGLHQVQVRLENGNRRWQETFDDVRRQLSELFPEGYLVQTPWNWLEQYPRYLSAIMARLDKLSDARGSGDWAAMHSLQAMWQAYTERREQLAAQGRSDEQLETFRWMIEEYRVSLFAQSLGTVIKVSPQRLEKQWKQVR